MPLYKTWDVTRHIRKSVVANSLEELLNKGKKKLGLDDLSDLKVFDEEDGTEIDDDDTLLAYAAEKRNAVFIIAQDWMEKAVPETKFEEKHPELLRYEEMEIEDPSEEIPACSTSEASDETRSPGYLSDLAEKDEVPDDWADFPGSDCTVGHEGGGFHDDISASIAAGTSKTKGEKRKIHELEDEDLVQKTRKTEKKDDEVECETARNEASGPSGSDFSSKLMKNRYQNAKMKGFKIYNEDEISATSIPEMEKRRRRFWNEKAEQVLTNKKTSHLDKVSIMGIIDVSWTLRKTFLIENQYKKTVEQENTIVEMYDGQAPPRLAAKKETMSKNVERMNIAHNAVENANKEIEENREKYKESRSLKQRQSLKADYDRKKTVLDGTYTELKRAQDACNKSIKVRQTLLNNIMQGKRDECQEQSEDDK